MILLSVIIPTLNRADYISRLLDSLALLEPSNFEWEVIVVDNGSIDNTSEVVHQKQLELPIKIRYVLEPRPGLHEGRHRGIKEASGQYIAYLDDDMILAPTWLQGIKMVYEKKADAVIGRILPRWDGTPPNWLMHMYRTGVLSHLGLLDLGKTPMPTDFFFGGNLFIMKKTIISFRGFHPDGMPPDMVLYRGDGETGLWMKMRAAGMDLWYEPAALAYHIIPQERMTIEYFCKRAYNQGISNSFTDIRVRRGLYSDVYGGLFYWKRVIKKWLNHCKPLIFARYYSRYLKAKTDMEREVLQIQLKMTRSENRGWASHRMAVRCNHTLRKYVLQQSYF